MKSVEERQQITQDIKDKCEADLWTFAQIVEPHRVYGSIHEEMFKWWQYTAGDNSLVLLPRDHQKSHCMAVLAAWLITRDPSISILYISATSYLAQQQLRDIKNIPNWTMLENQSSGTILLAMRMYLDGVVTTLHREKNKD